MFYHFVIIINIRNILTKYIVKKIHFYMYFKNLRCKIIYSIKTVFYVHVGQRLNT